MGNGPVKEFKEPARRVLQKEVHVSASGPRCVAIFAGGCFWGIELVFQRVPGVVETEVGYCQGLKKNPSYEEVCSGTTGHAEAVRVTFDSTAIRYEDLLTVFWDVVDPTAVNRQGNDVGTQYRTGIYYSSEQQRVAAERSRDDLQRKLGPTATVATEVEQAQTWYRAEEYHQRYLAKGGQCARTGDLSPIRCYG
eukprot:gene22266-30509_t